MKILLVLILAGAMGFVIYKQSLQIKDMKAQNEECERKISQLEAEVTRLKTAPPPPRQFVPSSTPLDSNPQGGSGPDSPLPSTHLPR